MSGTNSLIIIILILNDAVCVAFYKEKKILLGYVSMSIFQDDHAKFHQTQRVI